MTLQDCNTMNGALTGTECDKTALAKVAVVVYGAEQTKSEADFADLAKWQDDFQAQTGFFVKGDGVEAEDDTVNEFEAQNGKKIYTYTTPGSFSILVSGASPILEANLMKFNGKNVNLYPVDLGNGLHYILQNGTYNTIPARMTVTKRQPTELNGVDVMAVKFEYEESKIRNEYLRVAWPENFATPFVPMSDFYGLTPIKVLENTDETSDTSDQYVIVGNQENKSGLVSDYGAVTTGLVAADFVVTGSVDGALTPDSITETPAASGKYVIHFDVAVSAQDITVSLVSSATMTVKKKALSTTAPTCVITVS